MDMRKGNCISCCVVLCCVLYCSDGRVFSGGRGEWGYVYFYAILRYAVYVIFKFITRRTCTGLVFAGSFSRGLWVFGRDNECIVVSLRTWGGEVLEGGKEGF